MVVARWVRPAKQHAQDVPLVGEARCGFYFSPLSAESLYTFNLLLQFHYVFFFFFLRVFLYFGCFFFSKEESFVLGLSFAFFVFYLVSVNFESGFQKNNFSS